MKPDYKARRSSFKLHIINYYAKSFLRHEISVKEQVLNEQNIALEKNTDTMTVIIKYICSGKNSNS